MQPWDHLEPTPGRLVIEPDPMPEEIGTIKVPEVAVDRGDAGVIRRAGDGCHPDFYVGCRVAFRPFTGHEFKIEDSRLLVIHQSEILCILESPE